MHCMKHIFRICTPLKSLPTVVGTSASRLVGGCPLASSDPPLPSQWLGEGTENGLCCCSLPFYPTFPLLNLSSASFPNPQSEKRLAYHQVRGSLLDGASDIRRSLARFAAQSYGLTASATPLLGVTNRPKSTFAVPSISPVLAVHLFSFPFSSTEKMFIYQLILFNPFRNIRK